MFLVHIPFSEVRPVFSPSLLRGSDHWPLKAPSDVRQVRRRCGARLGNVLFGFDVVPESGTLVTETVLLVQRGASQDLEWKMRSGYE